MQNRWIPLLELFLQITQMQTSNAKPLEMLLTVSKPKVIHPFNSINQTLYRPKKEGKTISSHFIQLYLQTKRNLRD